MTAQIQVPADLNGARADRTVAVLCGISRRAARLTFESGGVKRGGVAIAGSSKVAEGEILGVDLVAEEAEVIPEESVEFAVAFEDEDVIVVDKPAGVVVHPGAGRTGGTLANGLLSRYPEIVELGPEHRWGIVHRIDRDTSGLLIVGKNAAAVDHLQAALKRREIKREYRALVVGRVCERYRDRRRTRRTRSCRADSYGGGRNGATRANALPTIGSVGRRRCVIGLGDARDGPHTSDPGAYAIDRASGGGGSGLRQETLNSRRSRPNLASRGVAHVRASVRFRPDVGSIGTARGPFCLTCRAW